MNNTANKFFRPTLAISAVWIATLFFFCSIQASDQVNPLPQPHEESEVQLLPLPLVNDESCLRTVVNTEGSTTLFLARNISTSTLYVTEVFFYFDGIYDMDLLSMAVEPGACVSVPIKKLQDGAASRVESPVSVLNSDKYLENYVIVGGKSDRELFNTVELALTLISD